MKNFIIRVAIEFAAIVAAVTAAIQLVKNGHPALGLSVLAVFSMISLYRLGIEKVNGQRDRGIKGAQIRCLKDSLSLKEAQMRRLEAAMVDAASKALWVSDVKVRDNKVVYKIDVPNRGRIVIYLPVDDAPVASNKG